MGHVCQLNADRILEVMWSGHCTHPVLIGTLTPVSTVTTVYVLRGCVHWMCVCVVFGVCDWVGVTSSACDPRINGYIMLFSENASAPASSMSVHIMLKQTHLKDTRPKRFPRHCKSNSSYSAKSFSRGDIYSHLADSLSDRAGLFLTPLSFYGNWICVTQQHINHSPAPSDRWVLASTKDVLYYLYTHDGTHRENFWRVLSLTT